MSNPVKNLKVCSCGLVMVFEGRNLNMNSYPPTVHGHWCCFKCKKVEEEGDYDDPVPCRYRMHPLFDKWMESNFDTEVFGLDVEVATLKETP